MPPPAISNSDALAEFVRPLARHHYSAGAVGLFVQFVLSAATSGRAAAATLGLIAPLLPDYLVRQQLGHSGNGVTFRVYVHDALDIRREAVRRLSALLFPNVPSSGGTGKSEEEQSQPRVVRSVSTTVN